MKWQRMKAFGPTAKNLIIASVLLPSICLGDDRKWVWNDNRRSDDGGSNQNVASAGQITLKLDDQIEANNNRYTQKPQGDSPSSDQPNEFNENEDGVNSDQDYFRPNHNRPYNPQGGRYPVDVENYAGGGRYPAQGGGYPFGGNRFPPGVRPYPNGPYQPGVGGYPPNRYPNNRFEGDRFRPGNPSKFSYNNIPFRPSRPFSPGLEGSYPGPWAGNNGNPRKCACVPFFTCSAPATFGGQCAPGKSLCCHKGFGGPAGPIGPGAPIRRPQYHSIENGVLAGPGGPVDPIPGQSQNSISTGNQSPTLDPNAVFFTTPQPQTPSNRQLALNYRPIRNEPFTGQTDGRPGDRRFYYRILRGPIYNKPPVNNYKTIDNSTLPKPAKQNDGRSGFRFSLSFMSGNFIPENFNRPFGGPYGQGPAGPYGNGYDNYARKAS